MSPDPAVAAARVAVRRSLADLPDGAVVLVACSGGADSLALLAATVFEGHARRMRVVGAVVDHGMQDGSAAHTDAVVAQMARLGVDETISARVRVDDGGLGPEAGARQARYAVLEEMATRFDAAAVLLGHTRDDQAETVLLGLARGSGGRSIAGMRRAYDAFRRPLLDLTREQTAAACAAEGIEPWADPHNDDPRFARVRARHHVLPVLEAELGPGVAAALARTADLLRPDMEYLDDLADEAFARLRAEGTTQAAGDHDAPHGPADGPHAAVVLPVAGLADLPTPLRTRVLRRAALAAGAPGSELFHEHVVATEALVTDWRGQRWIDLPGHVRAQRRDGILVIGSTRGS